MHPRDNDLILGTHGRSFIVLDDISPLQQLNATILAAPSHVFDVGPAVQYIPNENGWFLGGRSFRAPNRALGAFVNYYLRAAAKDDVAIAISDASGKVVRQLKGPKTAGLHRVAWDLRAEPFGPSSSWSGRRVRADQSRSVRPAWRYRVQVTVDGTAETKTAKVMADPLVQISDTDRATLYQTLLTLTEMQRTAASAADAATKLDDQHAGTTRR